MGEGSVMSDAADGSWRLTPEHAALTQGLMVSPFGHLAEGSALFLELPAPLRQPADGAWLQALRAVCPITDATAKQVPAAAIAFTWTGLQAMGLDPDTLATFSSAFIEGMHQIDRKRRLSDLPDSGTVIDAGPQWSGNTPDRVPDPSDPTVDHTSITVHAALLLYAADTDLLATFEAAATSALSDHGVEIRHRLELSLRFDAQGQAREHFGFADGLSQPVPEGDSIVSHTNAALPRDRLHGIAAGDVLMGHLNAQNEPAPGPMVARACDPQNFLPAQGAPEGFRNLGLDGSYLVMRELRQDVAAFWASMEAGKGDQDAEWLASHVVGRTMNGDVLTPAGALPRVGKDPHNDFTFFATDPHGLGCPIGSHVRRANPRDGLAPDAQTAPDLLQAAQNHRILRRGRKFGPTIADPRQDDGATRGLLFMCLNTDLVRQFEFVQQTWMLNTSFGSLMHESDPLLGPHGRFTIPAEPLRYRPVIDTFIRFAGGEYFFLPSLPALNYLQSLQTNPMIAVL